MLDSLVYSKSEPQRLDTFLVDQLGISRSQIKKMIDNSQVLVNGKPATKTGLSLELNDQIQILEAVAQPAPTATKPTVSSRINQDVKLAIVFEDDYLMVINKPTNMLVYPTIHHEPNTLVDALQTYLKWNPNDFSDPTRMGIVHRLDKDTCGLMIIAKTPMMVDQLSQLFLDHQIEKHYHAIVYNHFSDLNKNYYVDVMLGYGKTGEYKMRIGPDARNAKQAISIVTPLLNLNQGFSLVDVQILTGRTHQIRATMRYLNHPLLNDNVYGPRAKTTSYGQYLICKHIKFIHPITHESLSFEIPYDVTFQEMYDKLCN